MRTPFLVLFIFIRVGIGISQQTTQGYFTTGLNRIGVLYEIGVKQNWALHGVSVGLRFYEPDLVFEKNWPGLRVGYAYILRNEKRMKLNVGADLSAFFEKKETVSLTLFDPKFRIEPLWNLNNACDFSISAAAGGTFNWVGSVNSSNKKLFTYLNYEIAATFAYRFGHASQP